MSKFDTRTMYNFEKYIQLQKSGEVNMVSPEVRNRLDITKDEHLFILNNYDALLKEFNELKVVDKVLEDARQRVNGDKEQERDMGFSREVQDIEINNE